MQQTPRARRSGVLGTIALVIALMAVILGLMFWAAYAPIPSSQQHTAPISHVTSCTGAQAEICEYLAINSSPVFPATCPYFWRAISGDTCSNPKIPSMHAQKVCPVQTVLVAQTMWKSEQFLCVTQAGLSAVCLLPSVDAGYLETGDNVQCVNLARVATRADLAQAYYAPTCGAIPSYVPCYSPCYMGIGPVPCGAPVFFCSPFGVCQ